MLTSFVKWIKRPFNEWYNPYYYWWKTRKYFIRPHAHLVKGIFPGYFGLPCRNESYHKGLNFFIRGLGWKSKWNSPRHEWDPIICFIWVNPWKTWTSSEFSKETNSKDVSGFYENKQYWFGWIFNWVRRSADWKDDSNTASMATWEAILDYYCFNRTDISKLVLHHRWYKGVDNKEEITILKNLTIEGLKQYERYNDKTNNN